jgi:hypothetical protein
VKRMDLVLAYLFVLHINFGEARVGHSPASRR